MKKYIAFIRHVECTVVDTPGYVFEAPNDDTALNVILAYLRTRYRWKLQFLARITQEIQVQKIQITDEDHHTRVIEISLEDEERIYSGSRIYLDHLFMDESIISQLQTPIQGETKK